VLSAAVLARGRTIIRGAAREPEIVDLGRFLIALGARIDGLGTDTLEITGVDSLGGACHQVIPDRMEAATLLIAAAINGGRVTVHHVEPRHLDAPLAALHRAGCHIALTTASVTIQAPHRLRPLHLTATAYPGLPTDLQPLLTAMLALASGRSTIRDEVFPTRTRHLARLRKMGADLRVSEGRIRIRGVPQLRCARVAGSDLRCGAALILAGLAAEGTTIIDGVEHVDRGYERFETKLATLGASIHRTRQTQRPAPATPPGITHFADTACTQ
jgi:UDP-N-acetylglucosamine 1-carboxyvinyltransferase